MKYIALLLLLVLPAITFARHTTSRINLGSLDDDVVEVFSVPVLFGVDVSTVTSDFGDSRGNGIRSHEGQDFLAAQGTPIVSPTEAIVLRIGTGESAGKYVYTANPGGETFRYMHLDEIADFDEGDELDIGDYIGTVGDTGNAAAGQYHLHFETRDKNNNEQDPYPRLAQEFTLEEKMSFLDSVFSDRRDDSIYASFLIDTFPNEFKRAFEDGIDLPRAIEREIDKLGWQTQSALNDRLKSLINTIPTLLQTDLQTGDEGARVVLLQLYIMFSAKGLATNALVAAGATGYYGSITAAAVSELQQSVDAPVTGVYDATTRALLSE